MRGDKSTAMDCLTLAAELAFTPFKRGSFPREKVESAAVETLDELGFQEDIEVYGHVLGRIPKKRIHHLFFQKIKYILFTTETKFTRDFHKQLLKELKDVTATWGSENNGQEEVAD